MAKYVYVFGVLATGDVVAELPMTSVSMDMELNAAGTWRGTFYLDQTGIPNIDYINSTTPGKCFVCVERDSVPIWFGVITSREYQANGKAANLMARTLEYYPTKQIMDFAASYSSLDPRFIFCDLWNTLQAMPSRNVGVVIPTPSSFSGMPTKSLTVSATDYRWCADVFNDMANGDNSSGFDYTIDVTKSGTGDYTHTMRIGNPNLGQTVNTSNLVFDYTDNGYGTTGNIDTYEETEIMGSSGNYVYVLGSGEGSSMLVSRRNQTVAADWLRWDVKAPNKNTNDQGTLDAIANAELGIRNPPMSVIAATLRGDVDPGFGSFGLGDSCRLVINDPKHPYPNHEDVQCRIIGWSLQPTSDQTIDLVSLTFFNEDDAGNG
jgi:hypothetical protein